MDYDTVEDEQSWFCALTHTQTQMYTIGWLSVTPTRKYISYLCFTFSIHGYTCATPGVWKGHCFVAPSKESGLNSRLFSGSLPSHNHTSAPICPYDAPLHSRNGPLHSGLSCSQPLLYSIVLSFKFYQLYVQDTHVQRNAGWGQYPPHRYLGYVLT
jgi:hypothetical protein